MAWLVIGEPHLRAVFLDHARALQQAVQHNGVVKALVLEERVSEAVKAAFQHGVERGNSRKG